VAGLEFNDPYKTILLKSGVKINAKSVVITTGVNYRTLEAPGMEKLLGAGIYYGAANTEASFCQDKIVMIVGGGNSAGQAAMYLSKFAKQVIILIRGIGLEASMSSYLIDQIAETENIELWTEGVISEVKGENQLESISVKFKNQDTVKEQEAAALFIFIGAQAVTQWLPQTIEKDAKNFIYTGTDLKLNPDYKKFWKLKRDPYLLETSIPGVFAAGDVRSGAMNRVASAVGEGAMSISMVHKYLAEV